MTQVIGIVDSRTSVMIQSWSSQRTVNRDCPSTSSRLPLTASRLLFDCLTAAVRLPLDRFPTVSHSFTSTVITFSPSRNRFRAIVMSITSPFALA